jgi:putative ABC transport system permease protein
MDIYAVRILKSQPLRLILTIGGVSLCVILMFFLLAVYQGVAVGSVEYIRKNRADLWALQRNATNILRGSSLVSSLQGQSIRQIPGVKSVFPVLLVISTVNKGDKTRTVFLTGFDPKDGIGGPPRIIAGRGVQKDDEIVLDESFAAKYKYKMGDIVKIQEHMLKVVGISTGTNAFVIQYAFVTLHFAQTLIGLPGFATCFLIKVQDRNNIDEVSHRIRELLPGIAVYDHKTFLENNIQEMESGFLPLLYTVALIGAVVLTVILSLLLSVNILERKKDFAILKTLGSPPGFLRRIIIVQALLISSISSILALIVFFPLVKVIEKISPEISTKLSVEQIAAVMSVVSAMSLVSSFISMQRLRRIYLLEVFK